MPAGEGRSRGGRRARPARVERKRVLVVAEGTKTEPQYLEGLEKELRSKHATAIVKRVGLGSDPVNVVKECIRLRDGASETERAYDTCVVLVDVDEHARLPQAIVLARDEGLVMIITNLKFEVWLRWHVENSRSALSSKELDRFMVDNKLLKKKHLSPTFPYSGVEQAVRVAHQADSDLADGRKGPNPSSAMPLLVEIIKYG